MTRVPLTKTHELRVLRRQGGRGRNPRGAAIVLAIYDLNNVVGTVAVPVAVFPEFQRAVAALRPPAPDEPTE